MIRAVVFDLDGVLIDSEQLWDDARRRVVATHGGRWSEHATLAMQGMSSLEWSRYMHDELEVALEPDQIVELVVTDLLERLRQDLPLLPGATEAVSRIGRRWPLAVASSANRVVIEEVLTLARLRGSFQVVVSSEEVARGKPAPDVYVEAARRLGPSPRLCAAVEDSTNGIRSAAAAGLAVVAIPNRWFPPSADALSSARAVVESLDDLTVELFEGLLGVTDLDGHIDEQETESFPASDPHSDWSGWPS